MTGAADDASSPSESPAEQLARIIGAGWMTQAVYVAATLGIADHLADGPRNAEELATDTGTHAPSLRRLLRALTSLGICRELDDGTFLSTETGRLLRTGVTPSLRSWALYWGEHLWPVWGHLLHGVQTGRSGRALITGSEGFEHLEQDPELARIFDGAMAELTHLAVGDIVGAYDFSQARRIVDVGGGTGALLTAILATDTRISGVLFDQPRVVEDARRRLAEAGLADRCEIQAGDAFDSVPAGGDLYLLKSMLHDWNDELCRTLLGSCRRAMADGARLLLVERIMPRRLDTSPAHQSMARMDLHMLVALSGRERDADELSELLDSAGFRVTRILPAGSSFSLVEAVPAETVGPETRS